MHTHFLALVLVATLGACASAPQPAAPLSPSVSVAALRETPPVGAAGDAADDPAIWAAPDPLQSRVIGTQKQGGLYVYDLDGRVLQEIVYGRPNNIDLVDAFPWADGAAPLLAASDRADNSVTLWRLDPATGILEPQPRARIASGWREIYGVCAARVGDEVIVAATSIIGEVALWKLAPDGTGARLGGFALGSIAEGCVIDAAHRALYVAQENIGVWRVPLTAWDGAGRALLDRVDGSRLVADIEGLALWEGPDGTGWLVASVQGRSAFALYDRAAGNAFHAMITIGAAAGGGADAVSGTDGVAVSSAALGPAFPHGLMVVQDDENSDPAALQNFKFVSWKDVESALER